MGLVGAGEADIDWDVAVAIGYRFSDRVSSVIGYRALGTKSSMDCDCALSLQPPET